MGRDLGKNRPGWGGKCGGNMVQVSIKWGKNGQIFLIGGKMGRDLVQVQHKSGGGKWADIWGKIWSRFSINWGEIWGGNTGMVQVQHTVCVRARSIGAPSSSAAVIYISAITSNARNK